MFNKTKLEKFSIRKFKIGVASAMIGASWMLGSGVIHAQEIDIQYHYVLESELTLEERSQIISQLPSTVVGNVDTYYMVYRPTTTLPQTSSQAIDPLLTVGGIGLVLVGLSMRKRKRVVVSLFILLASGQLMSVSAIENGILSGYDKQFSLKIGQELPETVVNIENYTFVGYLLQDNYPNVLSDSTKPELKLQSEVKATPEETPQPEVTPTPEVTPQPEVTSTPEETPQPEMTPTPEVTPQPEVTPTPEETPQPEVTPTPEATPQPEVTPTPEATPQPEVTPTPEVTPQPEVTPTPEVTPQPEVTPTPEETPQPEVTPTPEVTPQPEVTPTPEATPQPEVTPTPEATPQPEVTPTPEVTPQPEVTPTPEETPQPEVTPTPEETPQPEVTPTPEVTPQPEVTPTPEVTPQTEVTPTPEETPQPEVTPTPEETPQPEIKPSKEALEAEVNKKDDLRTSEKFLYATPDLAIAYNKALANAEKVLEDPSENQTNIDEALRILSDAAQVLNGRLEDKIETKKITRTIKFLNEKDEEIKTPVVQEVVFTQTNKVNPQQNNAVVTEGTWQSAMPVFDAVDIPEIEGYLLSTDTVTIENVSVETHPENKEIIVRYKEKIVKKEPEIEIVQVDTNSSDKLANVYYAITDTDNVISKKVLKVYHQDELVKEYIVIDGETSPHQFSELEHNKEYVAKLEVTYNLGEGEMTKETDSETFELLAKKVEFKNLKSTELYKIGEDGKATLVTGLNAVPTDKQNYMVKLVDSQNKEILLKVDDIVANGNMFRVTSKLENLVHYDGQGFQDNFVFDVSKIEIKPNHYTTFKDLVAAMKATPTGTFYLATDMLVDGKFEGDTYISGNFTGTLQSADGKKFSISGLEKPLFENLSAGSKILNLEIKNANVTAFGSNTGILARTATNTTITNLTLKGNLKPDRFNASYSAGSVVGLASGVTVSNALIDTNVTLHTSSAANMYAAGGVFGKTVGNTIVRNTVVNVDIVAPNNNGYGQTVGGVVGDANGGKIEKILVTGTIKATQNDSGVAAIIGKLTGLDVKDVVTGVEVTNGSIGNGQNFMAMYGAGVPQNIYTIKDVASGEKQSFNQTATPISQSDADNYASNWKLPIDQENSTATSVTNHANVQNSSQTYPTDFTDVADYQASHKVAYENFNKLLPFYDRNTVVKIANKVAVGHTLNTSAILSIAPLKGNEFVTNLYNTTGVDKVLVHFANGNTEEYALTTSDDSPNSRITEYKFEGELLYTPHVLKQEVASALTNAVSELKNTEFDTAKMREVIGEHTIKPDEKDRLVRAKRDVLKELYLEDSFTDVQNNLENVLHSVISNQFVALTESDAINRFLTNEVKKDKEKVLLGLAYLNKWYDVNFNDRNIKNLALYRPDFFGKTDVNVLDYLKEIGGAGYEKLLAANSDKLYADKIAPVTTLATITDYLERNKALFAPDKDMNQWFKDSSKSYIVESDTTLPNEENAIYNRLKAKDVYKAILLPLLTVSENTVFAVVHPGSISYGSFDTYLPKGLRTSNPTEFGKQVETVKAKINAFASKLTNYYNMWNGVMSEDVKGKFAETPIRIVDGYHLGNAANDADGWAERYSAHPSVREFFGPLGFWFPYAAGESGYADRNTLINLVTSRMLDDLATLTHEFIHHFDERNLFNGHKHRPGQSIESYALGLLESTAGEKPDSYGFNTITDIASNRDTTVNHSVSRFKSGQDLATYMKGMMDVTYTLDLLEAEAILSRSNADKVKAFDKISLVLDAQTSQVDGQTYRHANDKIEAITEAEADALRNLADLIQHNIVGKDHKHVGGGQEFTRDNQTPNYTYVSLYKGFYAAMSNVNGTVGSLQFRRAAFEFLAEKGWEDGFLNYATDKLKAQGIALNDTEIFKAIFADEYANYQDFKLKQFNKRKDALNRIKEITVTLNGKATQVNAGNIKALMEASVQKTLSGTDIFAVRNLKEAIIVGYMKATNDFNDSIYN